jgi:polyketide biosynthesis enoyl-CoA hydratase PksH
MNASALIITPTERSVTVTINRPTARNSINGQLLAELHAVLDQAEQDPQCRFVIIQGNREYFCTGMDFQSVVSPMASASTAPPFSSAGYMRLLKRFTTTPKIVISILEGQVLAGGVGVVAASDLVLGTPQTQFGLSEALWGLLPACVTPFLIRRIGFQKAYHMTLTTQTVSASDAKTMGLIDELTDELQPALQRTQRRLERIHPDTIHDLKAYFRQMWLIDDAMEATAVAEIDRLVDKPQVKKNVENFVKNQQFPWESISRDVRT